MSRRFGTTLIELLAVMSAATVLLGVAVGLLHLILRSDAGAREQTRAIGELGRLAEQFRKDVHAATGARVAEGEWPSLELRPPGGRVITYRAESETVERREEGESAPSQSETFVLPADCLGKFEIQEAGGAKIVGLLIESAAPASLNLRIEAALGREQRIDR